MWERRACWVIGTKSTRGSMAPLRPALIQIVQLEPFQKLSRKKPSDTGSPARLIASEWQKKSAQVPFSPSAATVTCWHEASVCRARKYVIYLWLRYVCHCLLKTASKPDTNAVVLVHWVINVKWLLVDTLHYHQMHISFSLQMKHWLHQVNSAL